MLVKIPGKTAMAWRWFAVIGLLSCTLPPTGGSVMPDQLVTIMFNSASGTIQLVADVLHVCALLVNELRDQILIIFQPPEVFFINGILKLKKKILGPPIYNGEVTSIPVPSSNFTLPDIDTRIATVLRNIRNHLPYALVSAQDDIREVNRNNFVLFLGNFLGAAFGVFTALAADVFTLGHYAQVSAQLLYGWGYSISFAFNLVSPDLGVSQQDFEGAIAQYDFLFSPDVNADKMVMGFCSTLMTQEIRRRMYPLRMRTSSNRYVVYLNNQVEVLNGLLHQKFS